MVLIHEDEEGGPFGGPGSFWVYASDHPTSGLAFRKLGMVVSEVHYFDFFIPNLSQAFIMPSLVEKVETMEELDAKIIHLQNKLAKRNDEYNALVAQIRHAHAKGMSQEEERRHNQRMREVSYQIRTIERRFDRLWDKKLYFRQLCEMEDGK
ncbi:uncharacterized protein FTOL_13054 [Fusarium torulosum]|uniref:Uncharacterized protein n=1 Tax=Fusarium torulosum TaxID=33205 RepID=A0AAE8MLY4_9HYPO|nr:uncharacterized protein FTOL_13054 [Fusarium torulosum]